MPRLPVLRSSTRSNKRSAVFVKYRSYLQCCTTTMTSHRDGFVGYVNTDTLLVAPAAAANARLPHPLMQSMSKRAFLSTSQSNTVMLVVANAKGEYFSIGHDDFPIQILKKASPVLENAIRPNATLLPMQSIALPPNDFKSYQRLFDAVLQSFNDGRFTYVLTVSLTNKNNHPITEYYLMMKAASDLGMTWFKHDLANRIRQLLFPNLKKMWFGVHVADINLLLSQEEVQKGTEIWHQVADGIGRAYIAMCIKGHQLPGLYALFKENVAFKETVDEYRTIWAAKKAAGEDILVMK